MIMLGGGFHRYSTDNRWLVPHFNKMLYDNALLARTYVEAYQVTHDPNYRRVAIETLDYILQEMTSPDGGFYSATDADSEGVEGKFFVWTPEQIRAVLSSTMMPSASVPTMTLPRRESGATNVLNTRHLTPWSPRNWA